METMRSTAYSVNTHTVSTLVRQRWHSYTLTDYTIPASKTQTRGITGGERGRYIHIHIPYRPFLWRSHQAQLRFVLKRENNTTLCHILTWQVKAYLFWVLIGTSQGQEGTIAYSLDSEMTSMNSLHCFSGNRGIPHFHWELNLSIKKK